MIRDAKKFKIKRSQWSYGSGADTKLLTDDGKRDCIGFFLEASGLDTSQMLGFEEPIDVLRKHKCETKLVHQIGNAYFQSDWCMKIIMANDDPSTTLPQREEALKNLFQSMNVNLTFED